MDNKMASRAIFHTPCAFGPNGAPLETCKQMTAIAARNLNGCARINCRSPLRICRACVTQGECELVTDFDKGLCDFHAEYGADAVPSKQKPEKPLPGDEDTSDRLPAVARRAEAVAGNDNVVRLELCTPVPSLHAPAPDAHASAPHDAKPKTRTPKLPPAPGRASFKRGLMRVINPDTGAYERIGALETMAMLRKLHDERRISWEKAGGLLDLSKNAITVLRTLEKLPEHIRNRLSSSMPPQDRLGVAFAYELTLLPPEKQEEAVAAYLSGKQS